MMRKTLLGSFCLSFMLVIFFSLAVEAGLGVFVDSGQNLVIGNSDSRDAVLGDLDGDGDLDAVVSTIYESVLVWFNDGSGTFTDSGQRLGSAYSEGVKLGDLDDDGDLDLFVANYYSPEANKVYLNDGTGTLTDSGQNLGNSRSYDVALGDLDGDGDLDAFIANMLPAGNKVWFNDGNGNFSDSGQALGSLYSYGISLGDLDGDNDLDAVVANVNAPSKVWMNDGSGNFTDSGQNLGVTNQCMDVGLGDLDGDGDIDAFLSEGYENTVWMNDGSGNFTDSGQYLGDWWSYSVALGDLDSDGDIDAYVGNEEDTEIVDKVWLNDGSGNFTDSGQNLGTASGFAVALGDVNGDGDLDAFVSNYSAPDKIWLNVGRLTLSPGTGRYVSTQSFDFTIIFEDPDATVIGGSAVLDGQNITGSLVNCLVAGTLIKGGQSFRCPSITGGSLGAGSHVLEININMSSGESSTETVTWEVLGNTEP